MRKLLIATGNAGKLREYEALLDGLPFELVGLDAVGLRGLDVPETGATFAANAHLKALGYGRAAGLLTLADDSGLCVDVLDGGPGIYSARYAGAGAGDADRRAKLLGELADVATDARGAYFACSIAVYDPQREAVQTANGLCMGHIASEESDGPHGFGYDPLFVPRGYTVTLADILPAEKDIISHRGRASAALYARLAMWAD